MSSRKHMVSPTSKMHPDTLHAMLRDVACLVIVMSVFLALSSATEVTAHPAQATTIGLDPDPSEIAGCEEIEVEIRIDDVADLYGADVRLSFDPAIVEVIDQDGGEPGIQLEHGDLLAPPLSVARNEADNVAGTIWYAASQLNPTAPVTGDGTLAIIHLRAVGSGSSDLVFDYSRMGNRDGEEIPGDTVDGLVEASAPGSPVLSIDKLTATTARLSWTSVPGAADYRLFRDPYAYFIPGGTPHATTSSLSFDDSGALGDSGVNHFYVVRAACDNGYESASSNRVGEFDFDLYPGTGPGLRKYNLVGHPLSVPAIPDADALAAYVGSGVYQVIRYDNDTQGIEFWLPGLMLGTNFATVVGEPYYLHLDHIAPSLLTYAGDVPPIDSVQFSLNTPAPLSSCLYNYVTVPLDRTDLDDADALAADVGGVYQVIRYDNDSQSIEFWLPNLAVGVNFPVRVGYPYILCLDDSAPATWPPSP